MTIYFKCTFLNTTMSLNGTPHTQYTLTNEYQICICSGFNAYTNFNLYMKRRRPYVRNDASDVYETSLCVYEFSFLSACMKQSPPAHAERRMGLLMKYICGCPGALKMSTIKCDVCKKCTQYRGFGLSFNVLHISPVREVFYIAYVCIWLISAV